MKREWEAVVWLESGTCKTGCFETREEAYEWANTWDCGLGVEIYGPDDFYDAQ